MSVTFRLLFQMEARWRRDGGETEARRRRAGGELEASWRRDADGGETADADEVEARWQIWRRETEAKWGRDGSGGGDEVGDDGGGEDGDVLAKPPSAVAPCGSIDEVESSVEAVGREREAGKAGHGRSGARRTRS